MGAYVDPSLLTHSGEACLGRLLALGGLGLPPQHLATAVATAVEVHVSTTLARLISLSGLAEGQFGRAMIKELEDDFSKTWSARVAWFDKAFGITFAGNLQYQTFATLIELRNAVVHGDGQLTSQQTRDIRKVVQLRKDLNHKLDVQCGGLRLSGSSQLRV